MNKDTIGNISTTSNSNENILFIVLIIGICIVLYLLLKPKMPKLVENSEIKTQPGTKVKETSAEQEVTGLNPVEVTNVTISISDTSIIEKPITEIVKETPTITAETPTEIAEGIELEEEQTKEKYVGYIPINIFAQTEPLYFPYVMMPKPNCVIKFPRKGRTGRKGFKEEAFKEYIEKYFKSNYQVFDDRFVLVSNTSKPYEPDFALINEKDGINIFLDIEIDEPYEGTNDIENRKPTHYKYSDTNRNFAFTSRGWIVVRFAEIQVHQQPDACCKFIAQILKSIDSQFTIPESLQATEKITPIEQWTEEQAKQWSLEKYREKYLEIPRFGVTASNNVILDIEETELGKEIEELVEDEVIKVDNQAEVSYTKLSKLLMASVTGKYASFTINGEKKLIKLTYVNGHETSGFCYVKNEVKTYSLANIENVEIKDSYYTLKYYKDSDSIEEISKIINAAIEQNKSIRIVYTKPGQFYTNIDLETGEIIEHIIPSEESERTLSDIGLSINVLSKEHIESYRLDENYVSGYCHTRNEVRTFKFNRIGKIEILDL